MTNIAGSCLCGAIKFKISGPMRGALNCHCTRCRKQHGAAFRSRVRVRIDDFLWIEGKAAIKFFDSSPGFRRGFCGNCGSPVINHAEKLGEYGVPIGVLDDDPKLRPKLHVFVGNKAPWFDITDNLPQHEEFP